MKKNVSQEIFLSLFILHAHSSFDFTDYIPGIKRSSACILLLDYFWIILLACNFAISFNLATLSLTKPWRARGGARQAADPRPPRHRLAAAQMDGWKVGILARL